jgi:hypothetical protein
MLQSHGLGRLEDGAGLMSQLGFLVQDHAHERGLAQQQQDADSMSQAIDQAHQMGMAQVQQPQRGE